jgi:putative FmdB family regulatory protein
MPIYDYQCTSCGLKKEVMRKISEPNLTLCPECGKETFAKQLSAPSFQLSGSGWYATDFKNSGAKKTEAKPEGGATESKASESQASESKPSEANVSDKSEKKTESADTSTTAAKPATPAASGSHNGSQPG